MVNTTTLDAKAILQILPHRYPFILIDNIVTMKIGHSIEAIKNVTINEPFFQGHFPGAPIMPGVLMVESMAQAGAVLMYQTLNMNYKTHTIYFTSIENVKFKKQVIPGDVLQINLKIANHKRNLFKMDAAIMVSNLLVAQGTLSAMIVPNDKVIV